MADMGIEYSREVKHEQGFTAVYPPGKDVKPGDIIFFPEGRHGKLLFSVLEPIGTFEVRSDLTELGVQHKIIDSQGEHEPYVFASRESADFHFQASGGNGVATGALQVRFTRKGAIYIAAVDCNTRRLANIPAIRVPVDDEPNKLLWVDTYLVTSVTIAGSAMVAMSRSNNDSIELNGEVKGLIPVKLQDGIKERLTPAITFATKTEHESISAKPWSNNVTLFFNVQRFAPDVFGRQ